MLYWMKNKLESRLPGKNINNVRYTQMTPPLWQSLLMKLKEEREKVGLELHIQKSVMAFGPITSWQVDEETVETVADFILRGVGGGPKSLQMVIAAMKLKDAYSMKRIITFIGESEE